MTPSSQIEAKKAGRTILVVDDEPSILNCVRRVLEQANYNVITSPSGNQAWEIIEQSRSKIDVVLTDIVMPGSIDGLTLAARIHRIDLKLPVLFITGALAEDDEPATQLAGKNLLLRKPFLPKQLVEFIDSHLPLRTGGHG
jgi:CheY-like chemotaxis protein